MSFSEFVIELRRLWRNAPSSLVVFEEVDSTNRFARHVVDVFEEEGTDPVSAFFVAYRQTAGRGRQGRSWVSEPGQGAYISLMQPWSADELRGLQNLPLVVGVGLCERLRLLDLDVGLKWPNDLQVEGSKLGGILIESRSRTQSDATAIAGFGVNYEFFDQRPAAGATSVTELLAQRQRSAQRPSLAELVYSLCRGVADSLDLARRDDRLLARYRELSVHRPGDALVCRVGERELRGAFRGFDEHGCLVLETAGGPQRLSAGEIIES